MTENQKKSIKVEIPSISGQVVGYFERTHGYLARPRKKGIYPGVVMIHEYWGLNEYIKKVARILSRSGYVVLAVDLFNGHVTADPQRAMKLIGSVKQDQATRNMRAAVAYLRTEHQCEKIASIGWCFGGGQSLQLALSGERMDGTVIYYGNLTSDKKLLEKISWPVIGVFGDQDEVVGIEAVKDFESALKSLHIENEIYIYPGLGHAFANPSNPDHAPLESADAWEKTLAFLSRNLKFHRKIKITVK